MRTIAKFFKVFAIFLVTLSLVTCSGAPSCTLEGSNGAAVGTGRFRRDAAASGCPTGGGGGGNNNCSSTLTPTEVLFSQSATGSINTLAINTGGNALALMCTTATANSGQIAVATVTGTGANYLYVLTPPTKAGANTVIINGFAIGHAAPVTLTPIAASLTITGAGFFASTFALQADPFGQFLTLTDTSKSVVHVLLITAATGALAVGPGSPFAAPNALFTAAGTANGVEYVYVSDNVDAQIRIFSVNVVPPNNVLTEIPVNSPFLVPGGQSVNSPITMLVSPNGSFLYTANDQSISIYAIQIDGSLTQGPGSPFTPAPIFNPQLLAVDNTGSFLYASGTGTEGVLGFAILANGSLTPISGGTTLVTGTAGVTDMVADPSLAVLYLVISGVINPYVIGTNTGGGLTAPTVKPTFIASTNLAIANVQ
jgi:hypothetical protein